MFSDEAAGRSVLEEAFEFWLANYRAGELGGVPAAHFLTREHLMAAFAAGVAAHALMPTPGSPGAPPGSSPRDAAPAIP